MVDHTSAKLGGHRDCDSGDIMFQFATRSRKTT